MKRLRVVLVLAIGTLVLAGVASTNYSIVFQNTASMPYGLYLLDRQPSVVQRNDIVEVCPNLVARAYAARRGLTEAGECAGGVAPLLKIAVGVPGDCVRFDARGVTVNGAPALPRSRAVARYRLSGSGTVVVLPQLTFGTYIIPPGEAWVWTPAWYSFDSRYYGPLIVVGTLRPLFVQSATEQSRYAEVEWRR